ncbi:bromodomain-containing protein 8-like [Pholidichthys leucotaenia]
MALWIEEPERYGLKRLWKLPKALCLLSNCRCPVKHCASKYSELLETTEAPKRKRGEKGELVETVEDVIVRRLTAERIDELKKLIKEKQEMHRKLKKEAELIQAGHLDSKLEELWEEIMQKKKREEEEAEWKRKNTDAAYQARQVAKNTPKRMPSVTVHLPSECNSPSQEVSSGDPFECLTLELTPAKNTVGTTRLMAFGESAGPVGDDINHGSLLDDSTQKKLLSQKVTPPPSPLLSELLKKGSILATNSRMIGEGEVSAGNATGAHDLQLAPPSQTLSQATEVDVMVPSVAPGNQSVSTEDKVSELSEEDVTVSYMGDELDLKTVGDIIAIIEDKADEAAEALDAAAVEAALSLCEENGHALSGAWDAGPFRSHESPQPTVSPAMPQSSSLCPSLDGRTEALLSPLCSGQDNQITGFPLRIRSLPPTSSSCNSKSLLHCRSGATLHSEAGAMGSETGEVGLLKNAVSSDIPIKCDGDRWAQQRPEKIQEADSVLEDSLLSDRHPKEIKTDSGRGNAAANKVDSKVNGPKVCGEETGDGVEEFLSEPEGEMELEPAASESEDGYSLHTASSSLQLHTTADSIPSSPASSQFSACSEDLEALQAHKIWKKAIMLVWRAAANHRYANVFLQPVTDEIAPGYHSIVHRPMDLATIKKNIETGLTRTTAEFQRDIMLMFQNAVMYNSMDHDVYHMALEMQRDVLEQIQQFLATQLIMETSESGISAKSLRGRDSMRKQDSTDKDAVSMSSPAFLLSLFDGGTRGRRSAIEADLKMKK